MGKMISADYRNNKMASDNSDRIIFLGERQFVFPSENLESLKDHGSYFRQGNFTKLRQEIEECGYLFIPNFHPKDKMQVARKAILEHIDSSNTDKNGENKFNQNFPLDSGVLDSRCGKGCIPFMEGRNCITHSKEVLDILEGSHTKAFFEEFLQGNAISFDFKWLRGVHNGSFTGAH